MKSVSVSYDRDASDYDEQGRGPRSGIPGRDNIAAPRHERLTSPNGTGYEPRSVDYSEPHYDEAPPLSPSRDNTDRQAHPGQPHPPRRRRRSLDEADDTDRDNIPQRESARRRILAGMIFFILIASIGSGAATVWFYFGPNLSSIDSKGDKTAATLSNLADEQRKLTQAISALQQLVQDSIGKNAAAREQDMQRLSAETGALKAELEGLRAAIANVAAPPRIAQAPKRAAVQVQKNGSERKPAIPPRADGPPTTPPPEQ